MVKGQLFLISIFLLFCTREAIGQDTTEVSIQDPCSHPVIQKAQQGGLRSVPMREIPEFVWQSYQCRKEKTGTQMLKELNSRQLDKDYQTAHQFHGWTVSCATATAMFVTMFYVEYFFKK